MPLQPLRDHQGNVIPHNHEGILREHGVIRKISEQLVVEDEKVGGRRISSMAFKASSGANGGMSVDLQHEIEAAGHDAKTYVTTPRWVGSVSFVAGELRDEGFMVGADPIDEAPGVDANPYHGEVWGDFAKRSKQRRLFELCKWFVPIEGVVLKA